jgi:hypothetical protein
MKKRYKFVVDKDKVTEEKTGFISYEIDKNKTLYAFTQYCHQWHLWVEGFKGFSYEWIEDVEEDVEEVEDGNLPALQEPIESLPVTPTLLDHSESLEGEVDRDEG